MPFWSVPSIPPLFLLLLPTESLADTRNVPKITPQSCLDIGNGIILVNPRIYQNPHVPAPGGQLITHYAAMKTLQDYFGCDVRLTDERLIHILQHPEMLGFEVAIAAVLESPQEVLLSRSDPSVRLFYRNRLSPYHRYPPWRGCQRGLVWLSYRTSELVTVFVS